MNYEKFENILKKAKVSKKDFSGLAKIPYQTVMNWKRIDNVPDWAEPFVVNYEKGKTLDELLAIIDRYKKIK